MYRPFKLYGLFRLLRQTLYAPLPSPKNVDVPPPFSFLLICSPCCLIRNTVLDAVPYEVFPAPLLSRLCQIIYNKEDTNNEGTFL